MGAETAEANPPLLRLHNLSIAFGSESSAARVTDRVSFEVRAGEIFGLVGESGCGKSVTCLALLRLLPAGTSVSGQAWYRGQDLLAMDPEALRAARGAEIAMIFQEPSAALNPLMPIGAQLRLPFKHHRFEGDPEERIRELMRRVGFSEPERVLNSFPHELSGGMLQRVLIAHALLLRPRLLLADEPTTALDVTVQAQILDLLAELQRDSGLGVVLITHNLALVAQYAGRVAVMYAGQVVEEAPVASFLENPRHPYSQGLLEALPKLDAPAALRPIPGTVPSPRNYPQGCRFRDRCPKAFDRCVERPAWIEVAEGHKVACHLYPHPPAPSSISKDGRGGE